MSSTPAESRRVRVRFAPSPTGPLHLGGVRTALFNYLFACHHGGDFILRIEDTDQTRFVPGAEQYIIESLHWAGIPYSEGPDKPGPYGPYRQSERKDMYRQYAEQLIDSGQAYYAFDTAEDLENMRARAEQAGAANWKYDSVTRDYMKNSLTLSQEDTRALLDSGADYVIRMKVPRNEEIRFQDIIRGWVSVNTKEMDDKVLLKRDGMPTYHLANIVDDYLMKITHVIRGEEWLPSAPHHVLLYRQLGWEKEMPQFAHLPLILRPDGNGKLSKRDGDRLGFPVFSLNWTDPTTGEKISGYREAGYLPEAFVNMLVLLGWHPSDNTEIFSLDELKQVFSLERVSKSGARFNPDKAKWFNQQYLQRMSNEQMAAGLRACVHDELQQRPAEDYLLKVAALVREKAVFMNEMLPLSRFFFEAPTELNAQVIDKKYDTAAEQLFGTLATQWSQLEEWSGAAAKSQYEALAQEMEINPGKYMQVLRVLLTGQPGGPDLWEIIALMGRDRCVAHLRSSQQLAAEKRG